MKKKILIIGASKGIGRCTREILQKNFDVSYTSRKKHKNKKVINFDLKKKYNFKALSSIFKKKNDIIILNGFTKIKRIPIKKISVKDVKKIFNENFFSYINLVIFLIQKKLVKNFLLINTRAIITGGYNISHYTSLKLALETFIKHSTKNLKNIKFYDIKFGPVDTNICSYKNKGKNKNSITDLQAAKKIQYLIYKKIFPNDKY